MTKFLLFTLFVAVGVLFVLTFVQHDTFFAPTEEEKQGDFVARFDSKFNSNAFRDLRRAEFGSWYRETTPTKAEELESFKSLLVQAIVDGDPETIGLAAKLSGVDVEGEVFATARPIRLELVQEVALEEAMGYYEVSDPGDLPRYLQIFADGTTHIPSQDFGFSPTILTAYLANNYVRMDSMYYEQICRVVTSETAESYLATVTLLPNLDTEDRWKEEVLFDGNSRELCLPEGQYPKYDPDLQMVIFERPAQKLLPSSDEVILVADPADLGRLGIVYFVRLSGGGLNLGTGIVEGVRTFDSTGSFGPNFIEFSGQTTPLLDTGAPVSALFGDELRLVGFIVRDGSFAMAADATLSGYYQEFPHIVVGSNE